MNDWTPILAAIIAAMPPTLVALVAMRRSGAASERVATIEIKLDGYMERILESRADAAQSAATAEERRVAAERAAETALEVAKVVAVKALTDQDAAEARTPEEPAL